jgi:hypothetical protein
MNVPIHHQLRIPLTVFLGLSGLALTAGCAVAPPGATADSAAIGPIRTAAGAKNFAPFPVPASWAGKEDLTYTMVVKAKTGTTKRQFRFIARSSMVFWLNCIGTGKAQLASPAIDLKWDIRCGNGNDPQGVTESIPHAAQGKAFNALVTVSHGSRWEVRVDAPSTAKQA